MNDIKASEVVGTPGIYHSSIKELDGSPAVVRRIVFGGSISEHTVSLLVLDPRKAHLLAGVRWADAFTLVDSVPLNSADESVCKKHSFEPISLVPAPVPVPPVPSSTTTVNQPPAPSIADAKPDADGPIDPAVSATAHVPNEASAKE